MLPAIPSASVRVGASAPAAERIERIERPEIEVETARREHSQPDPHDQQNESPTRLAADSPVKLQSTDPLVGTLLDVVV